MQVFLLLFTVSLWVPEFRGQLIRDFKIYDTVVNENATRQQYHWLKKEK